MSDQEEIWQKGLRLASILEGAGHEAYLVGGCVRDRLLGRRINDIDIATSALPEQVQALFPKVIPTGMQHGTVTVVEGENRFEVTTFRHESAYSDARHPDEVVFVREIREDLARRDFTINAIAYGTNGSLVDPYGGQADLERKIVRCVGAASERFGEDALRMLRGIRFAAEFGFELDAEAWTALSGQKNLLNRIAMERVGAELDKMLEGKHPSRAIHLLWVSGILEHAKDKLRPALPKLEAGEAGWRTLDSVDLRWAALLLLAGADAKTSGDWMRKLKFSSKRVSTVSAFASMSADLRERSGTIDREGWTKSVLRFGERVAEGYLALVQAFPAIDYALWDSPGRIEQAALWLREMPIASVKELALRGDELAVLGGREAGPWIAVELNRLLLLVALGKLGNEWEQLAAEFLRNRTEIQS